MFERVLGCHHEERGRQGVRPSIHGDRRFGHRFEQGRLRLRAGAVDLVRQHDVGEERAGLEGQGAGRAATIGFGEGCAHDVARQQVAGELDPPERAIDTPRQRGGERGLADARDVFEQQMAAADQRFECTLHHGGLAAQRSLDIRAQLRGQGRSRLGVEGIGPGFGNRIHTAHCFLPHASFGRRRA
jgi:hypothetical protein